jgi:hypothetical protein
MPLLWSLRAFDDRVAIDMALLRSLRVFDDRGAINMALLTELALVSFHREQRLTDLLWAGDGQCRHGVSPAYRSTRGRRHSLLEMTGTFGHDATGMIETTNRFSLTRAAAASGRSPGRQIQRLKGTTYE